MIVETFDLRSLSVADARPMAELLVTVWPKLDRTVDSMTQKLVEESRGYAGPETQAPRAFAVRDDGKVIAFSKVLPRTIGTSAGPLTIAGLARVCCDPALRGQGLGKAVVCPVFELVNQGVFPYSLFQTTEKVRPFYERLGCVVVSDRVVNSIGEDPLQNPFTDNVVMRYPNHDDWPRGEIDLRGPGY